MKIIGIEGSSFAGKTTLANGLGDHLQAPLIEEYIAYAEPEGFPEFATSRADLEEQIRYYASLEARRARDLRSIADSSDVVVVDRTAASLIAFQRAMSEDVAGKAFFWDADAMQKAILEQKQSGSIIHPDVVLVLTAGSEDEHNRRVLERGAIATITRLNDWDFSERVRLKTKESLCALGATAIFDCLATGESDTIIGEIRGLVNQGLEL